MDDSTKTTGTIVRLYSSNDVGRNSPHQIKGTLLTFADRQYLAGVGQYRTEVPLAPVGRRADRRVRDRD